MEVYDKDGGRLEKGRHGELRRGEEVRNLFLTYSLNQGCMVLGFMIRLH